jgi:hypothetical protein
MVHALFEPLLMTLIGLVIGVIVVLNDLADIRIGRGDPVKRDAVEGAFAFQRRCQ